MTTGFFAEVARGRGGVYRDDSGNSLLVPAGSSKDQRIKYTSASSLSNYITFLAHIHKWRMRYLTRGMGNSPDLCLLAQAEHYNTGFDMDDQRANKESGKRLDDIIVRALDRVNINEKADYGTAVHTFTEPDHPTVSLDPKILDDVASFDLTLRENGVKILDTEVFVADDETTSAGTFDHLVWVPSYGHVIMDKKTGRINLHEFAIQLSVYANGDLYERDTDERQTFEEKYGIELNRDVGIIAHIKDGETKLLYVDLAEGYEGARHAAWVRDFQRNKNLGGAIDGFAVQGELKEHRDGLANLVAQAETREELVSLYRGNSHLWTEDLTNAAVKRQEEIAP